MTDIITLFMTGQDLKNITQKFIRLIYHIVHRGRLGKKFINNQVFRGKRGKYNTLSVCTPFNALWYY